MNLPVSTPPVDSFRMRLDQHGQVVLEFGQGGGATAAGIPADPAARFVPSDHIVMTPDAACHMVDGLARALGRPLAPIVVAAAPPPRPAQVPYTAPARPGARIVSIDTDIDESLRRRGTTPLNAPPDPTGEKAAWLMKAVRDMAPASYLERSFRIAPQSLQANRFLLSIGSRELPPDAMARAWAICQHMGAPVALKARLDDEFARADHLHFGFEGEPGKVICKLYLERTVTGLEAARSRETGEPALQYVAFKWNVERDEYFVSHYRWHAGLSPDAIEQRLAGMCAAAPPEMLDIARTVVKTAAARLPPERLLYLEVTEEGQPRHSFDLNVYDARLQVRDLQSALFAMRDHFDVRPGRFQVLYDQIKTQRMGHLAGGIHRDGQNFFNLYFGGARQA